MRAKFGSWTVPYLKGRWPDALVYQGVVLRLHSDAEPRKGSWTGVRDLQSSPELWGWLESPGSRGEWGALSGWGGSAVGASATLVSQALQGWGLGLRLCCCCSCAVPGTVLGLCLCLVLWLQSHLCVRKRFRDSCPWLPEGLHCWPGPAWPRP